MARGFVFGFVVLLAVFEIGACLKCYKCNDATDQGCGEILSYSDKQMDCDSPINLGQITADNRKELKTLFSGNEVLATGKSYCLKVTSSNGKSTARTCVYAQNEDDVKRQCDASKSSLKTCLYCSKDLCNGSSAVASSLPLAFLAVAAAYLFYQN